MAARVAWGTLLLIAPQTVARSLHADETRAGPTILRLLGARHMIQVALEHGRPSAARAAPLVDGLHAVTAIGLGVVDRRWRRAALTDAAIGTGFALASAARRPTSR